MPLRPERSRREDLAKFHQVRKLRRRQGRNRVVHLRRGFLLVRRAGTSALRQDHLDDDAHRPPKHSWTGLRRHAERGQSQAMAMDLRRRNQQHVIETMDGKTTAPRAQSSSARTATFTSAGWITWPKVATRPSSHLSSVGANCLASGYSSDCRLDFDDGGRREEKRVLVGLNPVSKAVRSPLARRRLLNRAVSISQLVTDTSRV